ncbi:hypothetical protein [Burkholderia sp. LMU1-1-1.1]|uniref:hypothetical protein n=1 Tax=Burkholderia sp. LMU1-1-1.1 TaxID=3135266 RepID=UPI003420F681
MKPRLISAILVVLFIINGCAPISEFRELQKSTTKTDEELNRAKVELIKGQADLHADMVKLQLILSGAAGTNVSIRSGNEQILFGNHSGSNATITVTRQDSPKEKSGETYIRIVRSQKPGDSMSPRREPNVGGSLPANEEHTLWLQMSGAGAQRKLRVPCGYQLEGRSIESSTLNVLIQYDKSQCAQ